ncbi:MAG: Do family serine endopeptidase [Campylobacter sp.]|nr:Do family serine endopeptidase [Campylobacter sp.]
MFKKITLILLITTSYLSAAHIDFKNAPSNFERKNPENSIVLSYNSSINQAKKSVVNIATKKRISADNNEFFQDPFFQQFFGFGFEIPRQKEISSLGSGVIVSSDGYIVTNNHVVNGADEVLVTLHDEDKEYLAKIIGTDPKTDIAVIKIDAKDLNAIKFANSDNVLEGDIVFAIGNPFGVGGTITQGIVSALNKDSIGLNQYENFIQTDASINPGNSGGALVDSRGALVGINSAILSRDGGNNGVGFAIASNMVKDIAGKLASNGKIERGYIGVMIADLTQEQKSLYDNKSGALIISTEVDMPAYKAGLKRGDLVIKANGKEIKDANELKNLIGLCEPNSKIDIEYIRSGKIYNTSIKLANADSELNLTENDGLKLSNITPEMRNKYGLSNDIEGVLILNVQNNSKASKIGFMPRDIILQVDDIEIKNINELNKALNKVKVEKVLIWVLRRGIPLGIVIE